jgi:rhomboid protease GluP
LKARNIPITIVIMAAILVGFTVEVFIGDSRDPNLIAALGGIIHGTIQEGSWWRLLTAMFLHVGPLHLGVNLWALYQLGGVFEILFGRRRFLLTYFVTGIVASAASALTIDEHAVSAGASGAIFGILGALMLAIRRSPRFRNQAWTKGLFYQLLGWAVINVLIGFQFPEIDNAAHLGGFLSGIVLGFLKHKPLPPPPPSETIIDAEARAVDSEGTL